MSLRHRGEGKFTTRGKVSLQREAREHSGQTSARASKYM